MSPLNPPLLIIKFGLIPTGITREWHVGRVHHIMIFGAVGKIKVDELCINTKKHSTNLIQKFWFAKHSTTLWKYIYNVNKPLVTHKLLMRSAEKEVEQRDMMLGVQVLPTNLLTSWSSHCRQCCCYYVAVGKVSHKLLLLWQVIQNDLTSLEITKNENCHEKKNGRYKCCTLHVLYT